MDFIIVIKGAHAEVYEAIREDIVAQCKLAGYPIPIFTFLPASEPAIEIVWTDAEMELKHLEMISKQVVGIGQPCTCPKPKNNVEYTGPHHNISCPLFQKEYQRE